MKWVPQKRDAVGTATKTESIKKGEVASIESSQSTKNKAPTDDFHSDNKESLANSDGGLVCDLSCLMVIVFM